MDTLLSDLIRITFQLLLLGVIGGGVSFMYAKKQKNRELKITTIRDIAELHGKFIALRYEYNAAFIEWRGRSETTNKRLNEEELDKFKMTCFQRACGLIGEAQAIKPLVLVLFPRLSGSFAELNQVYQEWRRRAGENEPILQEVSGKSAEQYDRLRRNYVDFMKAAQSEV